MFAVMHKGAVIWTGEAASTVAACDAAIRADRGEAWVFTDSKPFGVYSSAEHVYSVFKIGAAPVAVGDTFAKLYEKAPQSIDGVFMVEMPQALATDLDAFGKSFPDAPENESFDEFEARIKREINERR